MADGPISTPRAIGGGRFEVPAYLSHGLVGLRVREVPFHDGLCMVNGFAGEDPEKGIQAAARAPYPLAADVSINGVSMSDTGHGVRAVDQAYDFSCGEVTTRCVFVATGIEARLEVLTFCSRREPTVVCQEIRLETDRACDVVLNAGLRTEGVDGH